MSVLSKKAVKSVPAPVQPRLLNVQQAANYLGVTVFFIRTLQWERQVRGLRLGHRLLFDQKDLDAFVEKAKVTA